MDLVGRAAALQTIEAALEGLRTGDAPAILRFGGEPGIGKSRLLSEVETRADGRGFLALSGRSSEFEGDTPFAAIVAALDDYLAGLPSLPPVPMAELATVFPAFTDSGTEPSNLLPVERYRIHRAVRALLSELSRPVPLVLLLDDLHWADDASVELLLHLLSAPPMPRVLVAVSDRPTQLRGPLAVALARGENDRRVVTVEVAPLTREESLHLIGSPVGGRDPAAIYRESGGNPLYLQELSRAGDDGNGERRESSGIPRRVLAAIAHEIDALPDDARRLAMGAAVAGDPFDVDAAGTAAGFSDSETLDLLDTLLAAGLVSATASPRQLRFRHPIVRRGVYEAAGLGWRVSAHRRMAGTLRAREASPIDLARHLAVAAEPGDVEAAEVLATAAQLLRVRAPALSAERCTDALRILSAGDPRRPDLLELRSRALAACGRLDESRGSLVEALAVTAEDRSEERLRLTAAVARIEHLLGLPDEANRRLRDALAALPDRQAAQAAEILVELAVGTGYLLGDWEDGTALAAEALAIAQHCGLLALEANALVLLTLGELHAGRFEQAATALDGAAATIERLTDSELAAAPGAVYYLAIIEFYLNRARDAVRHADRGIALCHATGEGHFLLPLLGARVGGLVDQGRLREALVTSEECLDAARVTGNDQVLLLALIDRTFLDVALGDLDAAQSRGEEALELATELPPTFLTTVAGWAVASALIERNEPDRAVQVLLNPQGRAAVESAPPPGPCLAWHLIVIAESMRGNVDESQLWLRRIEEALPKVTGLVMPFVWADSARAHVHLAAGDPAAASSAALAAADRAEAAGLAYEASRARLLAGRSLAQAGRHDEALKVLDRCRVEFHQHGAQRHHDQAVQELRRLGRRIGRGGRRGDGPTGIEALSTRESEIAELVAAGRTNKEIGEALLISTRTVERHLTHIFAKLGVDSRSQLGSVLERARARA